MVNLDELERLLLTNWTRFIDPKRLIAFVLSAVRDSKLNTLRTKPPSEKTSIQVTMSHFRAAPDRTFTVWVDFVIPQPTGTAVGTCELRFDPSTGALDHVQTLGNVFVQ